MKIRGIKDATEMMGGNASVSAVFAFALPLPLLPTLPTSEADRGASGKQEI